MSQRPHCARLNCACIHCEGRFGGAPAGTGQGLKKERGTVRHIFATTGVLEAAWDHPWSRHGRHESILRNPRARWPHVQGGAAAVRARRRGCALSPTARGRRPALARHRQRAPGHRRWLCCCMPEAPHQARCMLSSTSLACSPTHHHASLVTNAILGCEATASHKPEKLIFYHPLWIGLACACTKGSWHMEIQPAAVFNHARCLGESMTEANPFGAAGGSASASRLA